MKCNNYFYIKLERIGTMTSKYDKNEIIQLHKKYEEEDVNGKRVQFEKLWVLIKKSAAINLKYTSYYIGYPSENENTDTDKLFAFLEKELQSIGKFKCERKRNHKFQCDCDIELGCGEFIVVTWDPDTL